MLDGHPLGLAFTMTNVRVRRGRRASWSLPWWSAWLLDPMVSLVLLAVLRAEQVAARTVCALAVDASGEVVHARGHLRDEHWRAAGRIAAVIVLHSVPPLVVFVATEAVTDLRDKLGQAVTAAFMNALFMNTPSCLVRRDAPRPVHPAEYRGDGAGAAVGGGRWRLHGGGLGGVVARVRDTRHGSGW